MGATCSTTTDTVTTDVAKQSLINRNKVEELAGGDDELIHVQIFHRHGDRTPSWLFSDPDEEKDGHEEQTWKKAIATHYKLESTLDSTDALTWDVIQDKLMVLKLVSTYDYGDSAKYEFNIEHTTDKKHLHYNWMGALTNKGVKQFEHTSKLLRKRYIEKLKYIPSNINSISDFTNNIYYQCTNIPRTIHSAESLLMYLYPSLKNNHNFKQKIPIYIDYNQPVYIEPVYLSNYQKQTMINNGPKYETTNSFWKDRFGKNVIQPIKEDEYDDKPKVVQLSTEICKRKNPKLTPPKLILDDVPKFFAIQDTFTCELDHREKFPEKDKKYSEDEQLGNEYTNIVLKHLLNGFAYNETSNEVLSLTYRYSCGVTLFNLYNDAINANQNNDNKQFKIYSCHDNTLMILLCALNKDNPNINNITELADIYGWTPYASFMSFEVWQPYNKPNDKYIKVFYCYNDPSNVDLSNDDSSHNLGKMKQITINGNDTIRLDELEKYWRDIMVSKQDYYNNYLLTKKVQD